MAEHLVGSMEPEEIGDLVASEFASGEIYVWLHDAPLFNAPYGIREELDDDTSRHSKRYERYMNMLRICKNLAIFQEGDIDELRSLQIVGRRSDDKAWKGNPQAQYVHFHTAEASYADSSHVVSYWNAQTKGQAGDIIRILPIDRIIEKEAVSGPLSAVAEMQQPWTFYRDGKVTLPILDMENETVRYDSSQTNMSYLAEPIKEFFREAKNDKDVVETIALSPGDTLFIDNRKAFHSVELPVSQTRLTYRLLLYALKADTVAARIAKLHMLEEAS